MKYKILITLILGFIITSVIYFSVDDSKLSLLALGDGISTGMTAYHVEGYNFNDYLIDYLNEQDKLETYYKYFNESEETTNNLLNKINNNTFNVEQKYRIKHAIKEADITTIAIGMDELNNYALKNYLSTSKINEFINKYQEIVTKIKSLNNKKIFMIGLYSTSIINSNKINKINLELKNICESNNIIFIDIQRIIEEKGFFLLPKNYYINYKGQKYIFEKIKKFL